MKETASSRAGELCMRKVVVSVVDGMAIAPPELVANGIKSWEHFIVGFFVSKRHSFPTVRKFLENRWRLREPLDIKLEGSLFFIRIELEVERNKILEAKPLFIFGQIFILQQWSPEIENQREKIDRVPVWVKL